MSEVINIMYRARSRYELAIKRVEIERETKSCVWVDGKRRVRSSSYDRYFDTFELAKEHLLSIARDELEIAEDRLLRAQDRLAKTCNL